MLIIYYYIALNVGEDKLALFAGLMDNDYVEEKHLNNFYSYLKILKKSTKVST